MAKIKTIKPKKEGQHEIKFKVGGLHKTTHTPMGEPIPESKRKAALAGKYGPLGKRQAEFAKNVLHH